MMLTELTNSLELIALQTQANFQSLFYILLILWGAFLITSLDKRFLFLGIIPRKVYGIPGILFAPLLHANFNHLFFNSIPLIVLSNFILIYGTTYFMLVTVSITVMSGSLVWCFAKPGIHIGASALITGYWGLLIADIYQQGTTTAVILGLISAYYFGGIFLGIFPSEKGVSWEGHLFGLISGLALSYLFFT